MLCLATLALAQSSFQPVFVADTSHGLRSPVSIESIAGDDRLFLVEIGGRLRVLEAGVLSPTPYLDVGARIESTFFTGLRGVAFHPDYAQNGHVYLWYDAPSTSGALVDIVLARMTRSSSDPNQADPASHVELLREPQQNLGHACSDIEFGPDGYLYATLGDGGEQGDPACNAQNGLSLMGAMIRIDVDAAFPYAVPPDSPFVGDPSVRDEIWHLGLRHPWKWSFDRETGDLWIADVGQATIEEVDFVPAGVGGLNFGWKVMEGSTCFSTAGCATGVPPCGDPAYTLPIHEYGHALGCSITGGYVYRGTALPDRWGTYWFADYCTGRVWSLREENGVAVDLADRTAEFDPGGGRSIDQPVTFGEDGHGELWVIDAADWELYRLERGGDFAPYCEVEPNSTGSMGVASATGSASLAANDLVLTATSLPPDRFGLWFFGAQAAPPIAGAVPALCVSTAAPGVVRLNVERVDPAGALTTALDLSSPVFHGANGPAAVAGAELCFQFWHRDAAPNGSGTSAAVSVHLRP